MSQLKPTPIITIDGPSGSGKGTISQKLAQHLNWHYLDSGAIYRVLAYMIEQQQLDPQDTVQIQSQLKQQQIDFKASKVYLNQQDISLEIRTETCGNMASKIASLPTIRPLLLQWQRDFCQAPGLVADGRDMGTVVFPDAQLKVFLTASLEERAKRRYRQLQEQNKHASLAQIKTEMAVRDQRDSQRVIAPLVATEQALTIDSTDKTIDQVIDLILDRLSMDAVL